MAQTSWFDLGVRALAQIRPDLPPGYGCPICLRIFPTVEGLSLEDLPPASVGGRPVLLTCEGCNNTAGHQLDRHIRARMDIQEVAAGRMPVRGRFTSPGGVTVNADFFFGEERRIQVIEDNDPRKLTQSTQDLQRLVASGIDAIGTEMHMEFGFRHDPRLEQIAWLRVGYLFAFAAFGYRFILRRVLEPIREQIRRPKESVIELGRLVTKSRTALPSCILRVRQPEDLAGSVLISLGGRWGDWMVLLPGPATLFAMSKPTADESFTMTGSPLDLPRSPLHLADLPDDAGNI